MKNYTTIHIDNDDLFNMLIDRLDFWNLGKDEKELFYKMYEHYVDNGVFEGMNFNLNQIVDNDVCNARIITRKSYDFKKIKQAFNCGKKEVGNFYIEAANEDLTMFLVK